MKRDKFLIAKKSFNSRLIVGTGKYKNMTECAKAIELSGAEIVTVAVRRVNIADKKNVNNFKNRLLNELYNIKFFDNLDKNATLVVNVKNIISKAVLSEKELKILHGILTSLKNYKINN